MALPKQPPAPPKTITPVPAQHTVKHPLVKSKPSRVGLYLYLGLGGLIMSSFLGVVFLITIIPTKAKEIQKLRTAGITLEMSEQDQQLLTQSLKETEQERQRLEAAFPTESNVLDFINLIDEIRNSPVELVQFSLDSDIPTKIGKEPSFLPMSLVLRGENQQVEAAVIKLVKAPYFIRPVRVNKEYNPGTNRVVFQTQFHLFVSDAFVASNP